VSTTVEQLVFWELQRRGEQVFFMKNGFECDFIALARDGEKSALQVCLDLSDQQTRKREIKGLVAACKRLGLAGGTIVSLDEQESFTENDVQVDVVPLPAFLCEDNG